MELAVPTFLYSLYMTLYKTDTHSRSQRRPLLYELTVNPKNPFITLKQYRAAFLPGIERLSNPPQSIAHTPGFYHMTRIPVTQVDPTVLPVSFFDQTPLDSRFCPLECSREYWT